MCSGKAAKFCTIDFCLTSPSFNRTCCYAVVYRPMMASAVTHFSGTFCSICLTRYFSTCVSLCLSKWKAILNACKHRTLQLGHFQIIVGKRKASFSHPLAAGAVIDCMVMDQRDVLGGLVGGAEDKCCQCRSYHVHLKSKAYERRTLLSSFNFLTV